MMKHEKEAGLSPVKTNERYIILDALRGFAIMGICLANYPEFSLYTFQSAERVAAMPTAGIDRVLRYLLCIFVDGKFYTIFSLLFGIGFSIIISHARAKGKSGTALFYRRMLLLAAIGFVHLMFIWSGDILMLYALLGMLLPLCTRLGDRALLAAAAFFLVLPVAVDGVASACGVSLSAAAVRAQWYYCGLYGITEENFGYWLRDATSYREVFEFLIQGAIVRVQEFIDGNRYFKVLGLFLTGLYIGRNRMYARLEEYRGALQKIARLGLAVGLPLSVLYAVSGMNGHLWGNVAHTVLYTVSVYPMGFAYVAGLCLLYLSHRDAVCWKVLAAPGRMALTNYICQSVAGIILFYGIGLGLGAGVGLVQTEAIALGVYLLQILLSGVWLRYFRFGPLEWVWRMLTYGRYFTPFNRGQ